MTLAEWRAARIAAYRAGAYVIGRAALSGPTGGWGERAWCNAVTFTDPALRGFDDGRAEEDAKCPE